MRNSIRKNVVKGIALSVFALSTFIVSGDDGIKRFFLDEAELLCRINANAVDTISFSAIRDDDVASGADFLNRLDKILSTARKMNMTLSNDLRLYLGCKLPLEMKQTIFQVVSEHYAKRFAQGNYTISCTGHDYAHKLVGRGFFQDIDRILVQHGYKVKSVFLEKVSVDRSNEQAFAFTDITLTKRNVYSSNSTLLSTFQRILLEEKDNVAVDSCVVLFHAEAFLSDEVLQNELQTLLVQLRPDEMSSALKSSGNVNNPKLSFLYTTLKPAIRDTPSMQELSRIAHTYGYDAIIQSLGGEKLQLKRSDLAGKQFVNPSSRIYGIWGFSARKNGWENKANLKVRIVDVDAKGNILADDIKIVDRRQYW